MQLSGFCLSFQRLMTPEASVLVRPRGCKTCKACCLLRSKDACSTSRPRLHWDTSNTTERFFLSCADEFNLAVAAWDGGNVESFSLASNNNWTYSLYDTCGGGLNGTQLSQSEASEDLKREVDERGTFGSYPRVSYYEDAPNTVQARLGCQFQFGIFSQNYTV